MTDKKLIEVFTKYRKQLWPPAVDGNALPQRGDIADSGLFESRTPSERHLAWMCDEAMTFIKDGRRDKAMRWLGFVQGLLAAKGTYSIEELGEHSMPDDPLKHVDDNACRMALRSICEILYPDGKDDEEWSPDHIERIASVMQTYGVNP